MRSQIPEDVDIGLDEPEIDPDRVEVLEFTRALPSWTSDGSSGPQACSSTCDRTSARPRRRGRRRRASRHRPMRARAASRSSRACPTRCTRDRRSTCVAAGVAMHTAVTAGSSRTSSSVRVTPSRRSGSVSPVRLAHDRDRTPNEDPHPRSPPDVPDEVRAPVARAERRPYRSVHGYSFSIVACDDSWNVRGQPLITNEISRSAGVVIAFVRVIWMRYWRYRASDDSIELAGRR